MPSPERTSGDGVTRIQKAAIVGALVLVTVLCILPFVVELPSQFIVFAIGATVGATELITRYRDSPFRPVLTPWGLAYALINGGAAILAYRLIGTFGVTFGGTDAAKSEVYRIALASLGAMAFFRTGIFTVRIGDSDIPVGPNLILQVLLQALDRSYDRHRATPRSAHVARVMRNVSFDRAAEALPSLCFWLMQNVSDTEQGEVGSEIAALRTSSMSNEAKCSVLGLVLMNLVGERVLERAVATLGATITGPAALDVEILAALARTDPCTVVTTLSSACDILRADCSDLARAAEVNEEIVKVQNLTLSDDAKSVFMVQLLTGHHGSGVVAAALAGLALEPRPSDLSTSASSSSKSTV